MAWMTDARIRQRRSARLCWGRTLRCWTAPTSSSGLQLRRAGRNVHNVQGRVQRFWPALQPPPLARPAWQVLSVLLAGLGDGTPVTTAGAAFLRVAELHPEYAGLSYEQLGPHGALANEPVVLTAGEGA
jgi:hypothetical protein